MGLWPSWLRLSAHNRMIVGSNPTSPTNPGIPTCLVLNNYSVTPEDGESLWRQQWPHSQAVKTSPFHGEDGSSTLPGVTMYNILYYTQKYTHISIKIMAELAQLVRARKTMFKNALTIFSLR